uniref:Cadherin domain-containing protein n=1 Tax=Rhabditophanes sp. KR3021 TaxID=114890 RepID=A0AC35TUA6_9BILA
MVSFILKYRRFHVLNSFVVGQHVIMVTAEETDINGNGSLTKFNKYSVSNRDDVISFIPTKSVDYKVNVKMSRSQAAACPKNAHVESKRKPIISGKDLTSVINICEKASIIFELMKVKDGIKIKVEVPNNEKIRHSTTKNKDGTSKIIFKPIVVDVNPIENEVVDNEQLIVDNEHGYFPIMVPTKESIEVTDTLLVDERTFFTKPLDVILKEKGSENNEFGIEL